MIHKALRSAAVLLFLCIRAVQAQTPERPNIIVVIADDLNDYLNGYNAHPNTITPNLDLLREKGTTFLNAYASAPICAPSRTSFLSGKDLLYTNVYKNTDGDYKCKEFSDNFTVAEGNEEYFTIPQYLKDSLGYYTFNLNKIFHCQKNYIEFDELTADPCAKSGAWNRYVLYNDSSFINDYALSLDQGVNGYEWAAIPDSMEYRMTDYVTTDTVIDFIQQYATSPESACNKPFLIMLGYHKPHKEQFIPEKYYLDDYVQDFFAAPFDPPFNWPNNTYPPNGMMLPPQPDTPFADIDALLENTISALMVKNIDTQFMEWAEELDVLPEIDPSMTDEERIAFLTWAKRANGVMSYLAAVRYIDAQFGRLYTALQEHPDIYNNTIIVFFGDNGYSLSEKRHWGKYAMWETDVRVPLIIADLRTPQPQVSNRTVSLLDLFPTLIDMAGGESYPLFSDGSPYLDGRSLLPLLQQPDTAWVRPVLSATKKQNNEGEASCFPQYSVRDERFHFIRYQTNGGACDPAASVYQTELYEIGTARETDPNEWNNLAADSAYAPVIDYLEQFLPGGALYLDAAYAVDIVLETEACLLDQTTVLTPAITIHDPTGVLMTEATDMLFRWTNDLTTDTLYGETPDFDLAVIPDVVFDENDRMLLYLEMLDTAGHVVGMDMQYVYINPTQTPVATFNLMHYGRTGVVVSDLSITGSYTNYWWDFGIGPQFFNTTPGPYFYAEPGAHNVTCYVQYGNDTTCVEAFTETLLPLSVEVVSDGALMIWPNPSGSIINVMSEQPVSGKTYTIFNSTGQMVDRIISLSTGVIDQIDVSQLPQGLYHMVLGDENLFFSGSFVVAR